MKKENLFYLSLMLRDEMPEVRKACIEALLELYENHNLKKNLSEFTQTSKGKILALAVDNDLEVAELGVMLVSAVQRLVIIEFYITDKSGRLCRKDFSFCHVFFQDVQWNVLT